MEDKHCIDELNFIKRNLKIGVKAVMKRLENKIAVITGASTGIGQASAKALANEGAHVLALDISDELEKRLKK